MEAAEAGRPATEQAILALRRLNSAFAASNRAVGASLDIKDSDLAVLDTLHREGPQTPTDLAYRTRTHLATMTGILTRLERGGWIERRRDRADRRSVEIHATGVHRLTDMYAPANERLGSLLESWTTGQVEMLTRFLLGACDIAEEYARQP